MGNLQRPIKNTTENLQKRSRKIEGQEPLTMCSNVTVDAELFDS